MEDSRMVSLEDVCNFLRMALQDDENKDGYPFVSTYSYNTVSELIDDLRCEFDEQ